MRSPLPRLVERRLDAMAAAAPAARRRHALAIDFASGLRARRRSLRPTPWPGGCSRTPWRSSQGGVAAAVILELAHPAVRTGVWEHSAFPADPVGRLRRTGLAALVSVYGPRSRAEAMIAGVGRRHARVGGRTPAGEPYRANGPPPARLGARDGDLRLHRGLRPLRRTADRGGALARLRRGPGDGAALRRHGRAGQPARVAGDARWHARDARALADRARDAGPRARRPPPAPAAAAAPAPVMLRGAVEVVPPWVRGRLGLGPRHGLRPGEALLLRRAGALADRIALPHAPPAQASLRLGLPADHLYRRP